MTQRLLRTLARCGTADLSELIGKSTVELLDVMEAASLTPTTLAEIAFDLKGAEWFLKEKRWRTRLIESLSAEDANQLAQILGIQRCASPWTNITTLSFRKDHNNMAVLRRFFGLPQEELRPPEDAPQNISEINPVYPLFPHQIRVQRAAESYLESKNPRVMIHMPTGSGKTRTAMNIIASYIRNHCGDDDTVLWLAYSEELCTQAVEEFEKAWKTIGNRGIRLCRNFRDFRTPYGDAKGFVVGSLSLLYHQSLTQQAEFLQFARRVKLVILDEAHQATAPTYNHLLRLIAPNKQTAVLGLTATPGRSWLDADEDLKLARYFSGQKVGLRFEGYDSPVEYLQDNGFLAHLEYHAVNYQASDELRRFIRNTIRGENLLDLPTNILLALSEDTRRNALILEQVMRQARKPNAKILVFGCSVEHAKVLANLLTIKGYKARAITGDMDKGMRQRAIRDFRENEDVQILTSYDVLTTGFDAPCANVAVITRPTSSVVLYTQMVGRVARGPRQGGNEKADVFTVIDDLPGFRTLGEGFGYWEDIWSYTEREGIE